MTTEEKNQAKKVLAAKLISLSRDSGATTPQLRAAMGAAYLQGMDRQVLQELADVMGLKEPKE